MSTKQSVGGGQRFWAVRLATVQTGGHIVPFYKMVAGPGQLPDTAEFGFFGVG
jgi:hypothetical protein